MTALALEDDGAGSIVRDDGVVECDGTPSVRGPPSPGLRARTMDVAQDLMALRGSPTHITSTAVCVLAD